MQHPFSIKALRSSKAQHQDFHPPTRLRQNLITVASKMIWIRVLISSSLLALLQAQNDCTKHIKWAHLLQGLSSMCNGISETCAYHYNKDRLCNPSQMLHQVELNDVLLYDIMKKVETIYWKNPNPEHFIRMLKHTQHTLTPCTHHSKNVKHEPVATCFNKLEAFLQDNMDQENCAWEIVNVIVREILQRLEKRTH